MSAESNAEADYEDVHILIVDDDDISIRAIRRALTKMKLVNPVRVATDGIQGLEILRGEAGEKKLLPPFVVLLDINMPRMNGHEFLAEVRDDPKLRRAIIFVLTPDATPNSSHKPSVATS